MYKDYTYGYGEWSLYNVGFELQIPLFQVTLTFLQVGAYGHLHDYSKTL